jgi:ATP-dependent RNA helicase RhlE
MNFQDLGLISPILKALDKKNYTEPTPIQEQAIPKALNKRDILGVAQTGTGKTAAFSIPIIQLLHEQPVNVKKRPIRALILTPTRELAIQIEENVKAYSEFTNINSTVIFGGVKQGPQVDKLKRGVDILIATPGRLLDLMDQGYIKLGQVEKLVLDEADRMLDMGFIHDIRKILKVLPREKQTLFFSATMPQNIVDLVKQTLKDPVRVEVTPESSTAETVEQEIYYTNKNLKQKLLVHLLNERNIDQVLVFERTKHGADRVVRNLFKDNIKAAAIHGNKTQNQRQKALDRFKKGQLRVLVATDIAARGIDIDKLQFVINLDIPNISETYVHRIGRVGRAGESGIAISLCEPEEIAFVKDIEKLIGQRITEVKDHPYPQTDTAMNKAERKAFEAEKKRRRQEFFKNRNKKKQRN